MKLPSEDPARVIDCLKSLGLTKYEALVYITPESSKRDGK
jgi:hypothetical protein